MFKKPQKPPETYMDRIIKAPLNIAGSGRIKDPNKLTAFDKYNPEGDIIQEENEIRENFDPDDRIEEGSVCLLYTSDAADE